MPEFPSPWLRRGVWIATIVFWCACVYMTHVPKPPDFTNVIRSDKLKHFCGYGTLATFLYFSLWINGVNWRRAAILIIVVLAIYGALDERTQPWFGRDCDIHDWYADMIGVISALIFWTIIRLTFIASKKPTPV